MRVAHFQLPEQESPEWFTASDPESGCKVRLVRDVLLDGFLIQFDDETPTLFRTEEQLRIEFPLPLGIRDFRWIPFEMLRQHIVNSHLDMRYVELAAR